MTRINTTLAPIRKPDSILFGELAITAGIVGKPVAVFFSESTATLDCEHWKYFAQIAGPTRKLHIHGKSDIKRLVKFMSEWRLVIVRCIPVPKDRSTQRTGKCVASRPG